VGLAPEDAFSALPTTLRDDLLSAFKEIVKNYREHKWEPSELNGGKWCEAVYTICRGWLEGANYPAHAEKPRRFPEACWSMVTTYQQVPNSRSARILIPRMMMGLYDIRNNRGVGHAGAEVDPNHMDATAVLYTAKWLMAELVRPPWPADNDDPIVLVGFTSNFQDQGPLLRRVVEALSTLPVRAVVTRGQMLDADEVTGTANVAVVASAPHNQILAEAALAVTHCGHGTTMKALAAGVPMVCVPMGRDQDDNAARVVHHGVGVRLSPRAAVAAIRGAVLDVLGNDRYRAGAAAMAAAIAEEARSADAVTEIETVARVATGPASAQR
jgi:hypothetical protein